MLDTLKKRYRFRIITPAYPAFNIYSDIASCTTALGPVYVATNVNKMHKWDAEVIDENNLRLREHLQNYYQKYHPTILAITHDIEEAVHLAQKIVVLSKKPSKIIKLIENNASFFLHIQWSE